MRKKGCKSYKTIGKWEITKAGTWHLEFMLERTLSSHSKACKGKHVSMTIDKIVFTKKMLQADQDLKPLKQMAH